MLDIEKKQGSKLYSVAPLLLLLFKEDMQAAVVPKQVSAGVLNAVSAGAVSAGTAGGILSRIASASVKTKIIGAVVGLLVFGAVGGTVLVTSKNVDWEAGIESTVTEDRADEPKVTEEESRTDVTEDSEEGTKAVPAEVKKIVDADISAEEKGVLKNVAQYITATKWGEEIVRGKEYVPSDEMILNFIVRVSNENFASEDWPY